MKKQLKIIAAAAGILAAAAAVSKAMCDFSMGIGKIGFVPGKSIFGKNCFGSETGVKKQLDEQSEKYRKWFLDSAEDVYLLTNSGVKVHALLAKPEERSRRYVILCHGYKSSGAGMGWQAYHFLKMGYNVLAPDGRASGRTGGRYVGMGQLESGDLRGYINFILARDAHAEIALYGISMGGFEVMTAAGEKLPDNVKAVIEDSGYTSVWDEFAHNFKCIFGLPAFPLLYMASAYSKLFLGFGFREADAVKQLSRCKLPVLFIHGTADEFVPFPMLDRLYSAAAGEKEKLEVKGAVHMQAGLTEPELYWSTVKAFLEKHMN